LAAILRRMGRLTISTILACLLVAAPLPAQPADAPFTIEESGQTFDTLAAAVAAIGGGTGTILIAPGRYRQCAVQDAGNIAYVAREPGTAILDGVACEGKAALVLGGRAARVDGLVFQNLAVADGNGAGIRLEHGDLEVSESLFRDSQSGILSADDPHGNIRIEQSTFSGLGRCDGDNACAHGIYIGDYGSLSIARSRFERGTGGHYVKSRAARIEVVDSSFDDSRGHATNYMIDLSNGAVGTIARNVFVQGEDKENYSAFITIAPEGREHSSAGLRIADNEAGFVPGLERRSTFVANWTDDAVSLGDNRLADGIAASDRR
jgi:hypothetical protein